MTKWMLGIVSLLIVIAAIALFVIPAQAPGPGGSTATTTPMARFEDMIVLESPLPGATITSPLTLKGQARGGWYFEASFPVYLTDWDGKIIAQAPAQAKGEWMTSEYVPFEVTLTFDTPTPGDPAVNRGTLILHNDNPSGLPENDRALEVPVVFN